MDFRYDFIDPSTPIGRGASYWIDEYRLVSTFLQTLPTRVADLLDVALAIYTADRRSRRDFKGADTGQRQISVRVGVRNLGLWTESRIATRLQEFLYWLSEDIWSFQFVRRQTAPMIVEDSLFLFQLPPERPVTVSLFSGGLDSLAGLAAHSLQIKSSSHILVSGYTHHRLAERQRSQLEKLQQSNLGTNLKRSQPTLLHVPIHFGIHKLKGQQEEKGQRTRSVVFLALGAAVATQAEADTLWVYENGIGALNLPLNEIQLGVDNYRGVHPRSLMMAESLFELALEQPLRIRNPFLFRTKAEMCRALKGAGLVDAIRKTVSCDSFPLRIPGEPSQCGYCTSCVLRRQSLNAAGLAEYDSGSLYRYDVLSRKRDVDTKRLFEIEVMKEQVYKLARCLDSDEPWSLLTISFPELLRTHTELVERYNLDAVKTRDDFVQLYRTYVDEWKSLLSVR